MKNLNLENFKMLPVFSQCSATEYIETYCLEIHHMFFDTKFQASFSQNNIARDTFTKI